MELWIRSQDKNNLIKVFEIWIDDTDMIDKGYVSIMANSNFSFELGIYNSKERALEVLDEIQKSIASKIICNFNGMYKPENMKNKMKELEVFDLYTDVSYDIQQLGDNVIYEMPEE